MNQPKYNISVHSILRLTFLCVIALIINIIYNILWILESMLILVFIINDNDTQGRR
jgi:hypothetical protein